MSQSFCHRAFVAVATSRLNELARFYQALLQTSPAVLMTDRYAEFAMSGLKLALFQPQADHRSEFDSPIGAAISLCLEVADLDKAIMHLAQLGYAPPGEVIQASHGREIYAYDPDGNRLILYQQSDSESFTEPLR